MYKILTLLGNRPHFIKAASVSRVIAKNASLEEIIVHSGQHYDQSMSGNFFEELGLPLPKYNLEVGSKSPVEQMAEIMTKLQAIIDYEQPDLMVVYGDTNTTASGAITAAKNNIKLAHIEAGLREFDKSIPEEVNKLLTDSVTDLFFSPTQTGVDNLKDENKTDKVYLSGDVGIDLIYFSKDIIEKTAVSILQKHKLEARKYIFMTCHRQANTDIKENLEEILRAVDQIDETIVFAMHPRTKKAIANHGLGRYLTNSHIIILDPLKFWETQALISNARICLTDSGGVIKESYFHKVPGIIIDQQTEWLETIDEGWNHIAGPHKDKILELVHTIKKPEYHSNCLGDGTASERIVNVFLESFYEK